MDLSDRASEAAFGLASVFAQGSVGEVPAAQPNRDNEEPGEQDQDYTME